MNKSNQIITGIVIIVLVGVGLWFWYNTSVPSQSEIDAAAKKIEEIRSDLLTDETADQIVKKEVIGDIPVTAGEVGRDLPFDQY